MYFWASRDMILWVLRWKKENPEGGPATHRLTSVALFGSHLNQD